MVDPILPDPSRLHALLIRNAELEAELKSCQKELKNAQDAAMFIARTLIAAPRNPTLEEEVTALRARTQHLLAQNKDLEVVLKAGSTRSGSTRDDSDERLHDKPRRGLESARREYEMHLAAVTADRDRAQLGFTQLRMAWKDFCTRHNLPGHVAEAVLKDITPSIPNGPTASGVCHLSKTGVLMDSPAPDHTPLLNDPQPIRNISVVRQLKSSFSAPSYAAPSRLAAIEMGNSAAQSIGATAQDASTTAGASRPEESTTSMMDSKHAPTQLTLIRNPRSRNASLSDIHTPRLNLGSEILDYNGSSTYIEPYRRRDRDCEKAAISDKAYRSLSGQACFIEDMTVHEQQEFWHDFSRRWSSHSAHDWRSIYYQQIHPCYSARMTARAEETADPDSSPASAIALSGTASPVAPCGEAEDAQVEQSKSEPSEQTNLIDFGEADIISKSSPEDSGEHSSSAGSVHGDPAIKPLLEHAPSDKLDVILCGTEARVVEQTGVNSNSTQNSTEDIENIDHGAKTEAAHKVVSPSSNETASGAEADDESSTTDAHGSGQFTSPSNLSFSTVDTENEFNENHDCADTSAVLKNDTTSRDDHDKATSSSEQVVRSTIVPGRLLDCKAVERASARLRAAPNHPLDASFPLHSTPPSSMNMVIIFNIPKDTSLVSVLDRVCNGRLASATMCPTQQLSTTPPMSRKTAIIVFTNGQNAKEYVEFRSRYPLVLYDPETSFKTTCGVTLIPTATNPFRLYGAVQPASSGEMQPPTRRLFFLFGYDCQVVLTAAQLLDMITNKDARSGQISMYGAAIKTPLRMWDGEMQFVGMEFATIREAETALYYFKSFPILTKVDGISTGFYPDSCEKMFSEMLTEELELAAKGSSIL